MISAHLDSVRNEIIKMSLFIEVGGLIMGVGVSHSDHLLDVKPSYHNTRPSSLVSSE